MRQTQRLIKPRPPGCVYLSTDSDSSSLWSFLNHRFLSSTKNLQSSPTTQTKLQTFSLKGAMLEKDKPVRLLAFCCLLGFTFGLDVHQDPSDIITEGTSPVQIVCTHEKTDYFQMLWYQQTPGHTDMKLIGYLYYSAATMEQEYKDDYTISGDLSGSTAKNGSLMIQKAEQKSSAVYFCAARGISYNEAYFGAGTKLTVLEPDLKVTAPTRVKVLSPSEKECSSGKKTLVCVASGFYPDHVSVSWMINGGAVSKGVATDSAATRQNDTLYRITSRLTVFSEEWTSNNLFVCSVSFFDGTTTTYHNDSITGEAKKIPSGTELSRDKYLRITQSAKLSYIIFIVKSCIYGAFIWFVAWKLQSSPEKRRK